MKERAIEIGKIAALSVLAAGLALASTHARAQDPQQVAVVVEMPKPRAAMPMMSVGGVKAGQLVVIGGGATEVMSAAAFSQRPVVTPEMKVDACLIK